MEKMAAFFSFIMLAAVLVACLLMPGCAKKDFTREEAIQKITPELVSYCEGLYGRWGNHSNCPACRYYVNSSIHRFNESIHDLSIRRVGAGYEVEGSLGVVYGYNTRGGEADISFVLDENGNVISKSIEEKRCV